MTVGVRTKVRPLTAVVPGLWRSEDGRWTFAQTGHRAWWASDSHGIHPGFESATLGDAVFQVEGLR